MHSAELSTYNRFLSHDLSFYKQFFGILLFVALQNLLAYSVNIADNIMLGNYSQEALSGASTVNQIFNFISTWIVVMPLSFAAAFWWKLPAELVVLFIQSDQLFKCIPCSFRMFHYNWIHNLTEKS